MENEVGAKLMRCSTLVWIAIFVGLAITTARAEEPRFPYKAHVTADEIYVRSGPGQDFYPTDYLRKGDVVEVYRHDPGGWCAIRPPAGSFTWVSGRALKMDDDKLAVVVEDDVPARVGSRLSDFRDVIQIRLKKGEPVEILDSREVGNGNAQVWYKIAPPSGEFRWISNKYLDTENAGGNERRNRSATNERSSGGTRPPAAGELTSEQIQNELDALDVELSMVVVDDPSIWSLDSLRIRGETLLDESVTTADRGKTRILLNKIARFEDIKQRYDSVSALRNQNAASNRFIAGLKSTMEKAAASADPDGRFDGVGQLQPVVSDKAGAPRYALVDASGNVRCYVTPAPGVNLQNYIGRQVGLTGTRGYIPDQHAQHLTARQVTPLDSQLR
jgi:uncharacterized protein YgiM (DUF1202 family)